MAKRPRQPKPADLPPAGPRIPPPKPLADIIGQARAVEVLNQALGSGRMHHAWIFHGPRGVGKFTTALALAAVILDPTASPNLTGQLEADPDSPIGRLIRAGSHPDLHVIVKELARFADDAKVRNAKLQTIPMAVVTDHLLRPAALAPSMASASIAGKVFIVDEAELLDRSPTNAPVQNALLKTLEEPPPGTVIILITSNEERLLPTIRSRCQRVAFTPLIDADMQRWLAGVQLDVSAEERDWLLTNSAGSPGMVVEAIESRLFDWHTTLEPMLAVADRGRHVPELGGTMAGLIDDWAARWVKQGDKLNENRSKDAANRAGARKLLALVAQRYRGLLLDEHGSGLALAAIDCVDEADRELGSNVNLGVVMEHLASGIAAGANSPTQRGVFSG